MSWRGWCTTLDKAEFLLGTVTAVSNANGIRIQIDGQDEAMTKYYKMMLTGADAPSVNDRVVVMKQSGTYIILGKIGTPNQADGKVSRSGDTMTGDLRLRNKSLVSVVQTISLSQRPSSLVSQIAHDFRDLSSRYFGRIMALQRSDGRAGIDIGAVRSVNGTQVLNTVEMTVDDAGAKNVVVDSVAWLKALGLGTSGALPITIAQGGTGQTGLITTNTISEIITAASGFTITEAYFAQFGKVAMFSAAIRANNAVTSSAWTTWATLKAGKRPFVDCAINATLTSFCQLSSQGEILVSETVSANSVYVFSGTYLLP